MFVVVGASVLYDSTVVAIVVAVAVVVVGETVSFSVDLVMKAR